MSVGWRIRRVGITAVVGFVVVALSPLAAGASAKGGSTDFGDAPDGKPAGYGGSPAVGHFPSLAATPGPRHTPLGGLFLGKGVDGEADSAQVNKDLFDDGAEATVKSCADSTLKVALNGAALPAATRTSAHTGYVNAWFDWNRDGDWADPTDGCRPEWAIQNLPVDMSALAGSGLAVLPIGFTAGKLGKRIDVWMRVTVTLDEPVVDPTGKGARPRMPPARPRTTSCRRARSRSPSITVVAAAVVVVARRRSGRSPAFPTRRSSSTAARRR